MNLSGPLTDGTGVWGLVGLLKSCTAPWCSLKALKFLSCLFSCCLSAGLGNTDGMSVTVRERPAHRGNFRTLEHLVTSSLLSLSGLYSELKMNELFSLGSYSEYSLFWLSSV